MKLGKKPARPEAMKFKLRQFIDPKALPKPPAKFGHEDLIWEGSWGMLGNDNYGDCVWAGAAHETMMWCREAGMTTTFTADGVLSDYAAATGFDPARPETDQGSDMKDAASYRRKTGIIDDKGTRHKVAAYLAIDPGNLTELYQAMWLFGAVGGGIEFPMSAWDQFKKGKPWTFVRGSRLDGGHYIPLVAKRRQIVCVTWGKLQPMSAAFLHHYQDEAVAYVSNETLTNNKSPEGFDSDSLLKALNSLPPA
jgi:hypothetical protein